METLKVIKKQISSQIEIVDKGPVGHFLGMEIERKLSTDPVTINQKKLIIELLEENNMMNCKKVSTLDPGQILKKCTSECVDCKKTGKPLHGYADAYSAEHMVDKKSYTGFVSVLASGAINFESKKQQAVALSSTESEYMAISSAAKEIIYLRNLIYQLGFENLVKEETMTIYIILYTTTCQKSDIHIIHASGKLNLKYISSNENTADILTKSLGKIIHQKHCAKLGMV